MTYGDIKQHFFEILLPKYSRSEIQSIWQQICDFVLKKTTAYIIQNQGSTPEIFELTNSLDVLRKLDEGMPLQYALGKAWFCNHAFIVNPNVLLPRPETEELVYWVLENIASDSQTLLDIGTGSGCIALSLAAARTDLKVTMVDISTNAIEIAQQNAIQLGVANSVNAVIANALDPVFYKTFNQQFDVIVSNPPYISIQEKATLQKEVLNFEPHLALFSDPDPLAFYKSIITNGKQLLKPGGLLFFETHETYGSLLPELPEFEGYSDIQLKQDFYGKQRFLKARFN